MAIPNARYRSLSHLVAITSAKHSIVFPSTRGLSFPDRARFFGATRSLHASSSDYPNQNLTTFGSSSYPFGNNPGIGTGAGPGSGSLGSPVGGSFGSGFGPMGKIGPIQPHIRTPLPMNTIIRFVPQQTAWIVERMGKFNRILEPGLAILIPLIDRIAYVKSLKENAIEIPSQSAITADNVTLEMDGVLYTKVFDPYKASYGVEDADYAIAQLAQTSMRSEIGQLTLDHVLKERTQLNVSITSAINGAAKAWGIECLRYEIRDIHAPGPVIEAMHRQVTAERRKRASILDSEGERQRAINLAEGEKERVILASEANRQMQINHASGEAEAITAKAHATAHAVDTVSAAVARNGSGTAQKAIGLAIADKYVDAWSNLAKKGTAVVVPGNVADIASMVSTALSIYKTVGDHQSDPRLDNFPITTTTNESKPHSTNLQSNLVTTQPQSFFPASESPIPKTIQSDLES